MFSVNEKYEKSSKSKIRTRLPAGFLVTPPVEWIHFQNTTIEVAQLTWVCVSVRTRLMKTLKFGVISACLCAKNRKEFDSMLCVGKSKICGFSWILILIRYIFIFADQSGNRDSDCLQCIKKMKSPARARIVHVFLLFF